MHLRTHHRHCCRQTAFCSCWWPAFVPGRSLRSMHLAVSIRLVSRGNHRKTLEKTTRIKRTIRQRGNPRTFWPDVGFCRSMWHDSQHLSLFATSGLRRCIGHAHLFESANLRRPDLWPQKDLHKSLPFEYQRCLRQAARSFFCLFCVFCCFFVCLVLLFFLFVLFVFLFCLFVCLFFLFCVVFCVVFYYFLFVCVFLSKMPPPGSTIAYTLTTTDVAIAESGCHDLSDTWIVIAEFVDASAA